MDEPSGTLFEWITNRKHCGKNNDVNLYRKPFAGRCAKIVHGINMMALDGLTGNMKKRYERTQFLPQGDKRQSIVTEVAQNKYKERGRPALRFLLSLPNLLKSFHMSGISLHTLDTNEVDREAQIRGWRGTELWEESRCSITSEVANRIILGRWSRIHNELVTWKEVGRILVQNILTSLGHLQEANPSARASSDKGSILKQFDAWVPQNCTLIWWGCDGSLQKAGTPGSWEDHIHLRLQARYNRSQMSSRLSHDQSLVQWMLTGEVLKSSMVVVVKVNN